VQIFTELTATRGHFPHHNDRPDCKSIRHFPPLSDWRQ
jgi:hypothetical protein